MKNKILLRVILSPFLFCWALFLLAAATLFPLPILVAFSFFGLILEPFIWLLRKSGSKINNIEAFCNGKYHNAIGHFLGMTIYIWSPFAIVYLYVKKGELFTGGT